MDDRLVNLNDVRGHFAGRREWRGKNGGPPEERLCAEGEEDAGGRVSEPDHCCDCGEKTFVVCGL